jgi:hypothetical protein
MRWQSGETMAVSRPQRTKPAETFERTLDAMERAGFVVGMRPGVGQFSYLATKLDDFGYGQRIAITFSHAAEPKPEERPDPRFENWLVVDEALPDHEREALTTNKRPFARVYTIEELEALKFPRMKYARATPKRSKIAKAVLANETQVTIATAAVTLLIDEKIASLKAERPNSDQATVRRDNALTAYQALRSKLTELQAAIASFRAGTSKEPALTRAVHSFKSGVQSWWNKNHQTICARAYEAGLFMSLVAVCEMTGASGNISVLVSAALAGGKPIMGALKSIGRKFVREREV